jgi:flagellin
MEVQMSSVFSIYGNSAATSAYNSLLSTTTETQEAQLQLASGKKINSVSDDTSGYRVGKELETKISLMNSASTNVDSAKNLLSTAESALSSVNDLLIDISGKVSQATDPTKNLTSLASDINSLGDEISAIMTNTTFDDTALLSGSSVPSGANFVFKTGTTENTTINFGTLSTLDLSSISASGCTASNITSIDVSDLQDAVQSALGTIGNYTQRLDVKSDYLSSAISNAQSTVDSLFGADTAQEQLASTKGQIAESIATTMLSTLNSAPQSLLKLFQ